MNQRKWWEKVWQFLRKPDNWFTAIALVIGVILAVVGIRGGDTSLILMSIVAILGGLGAAQLISNYQTLEYPERLNRMEKLEEEIASGIKDLVAPPGIVLRARRDLPQFERVIEHAEEDIFIAGRACGIAHHLGLWEGKIKEGGNLRFIIVDPESLKTHDLNHVKEARAFHNEIQSTLEHFKNLSSISNEQMEVRLINYIPELILLMIDGKQPNGKIRVELVPYKCGISSRMSFELTADDKYLRWCYDIFRNACEQMWADATPWQGNINSEE